MLPKVNQRRKKIVGRGYGSGKGGHTAGRGQKGQKSRGDKIHILFEGYKSKKSLIKRLPLKRGKGKLKPFTKQVAIQVGKLESLPAGSKVNLDLIVKSVAGFRKSDLKRYGVKIVAGGKLTKKLSVSLPTTKAARALIEKAKGEVLGFTDN